jgi:hypothetical protein
MKKPMQRKLVLGREVVRALVIDLRDPRLQRVQGGMPPTGWVSDATCSEEDTGCGYTSLHH